MKKFEIYNRLINQSLNKLEKIQVKKVKPELIDHLKTVDGGKIYNINGDLILLNKDSTSIELLECSIFYVKKRVHLKIIKSRVLIGK